MSDEFTKIEAKNNATLETLTYECTKLELDCTIPTNLVLPYQQIDYLQTLVDNKIDELMK